MSREMRAFNRAVETFDGLTNGRFDRCSIRQLNWLSHRGIIPDQALAALADVMSAYFGTMRTK